LTSLEGNIYRGIDALLEENQSLLNDEKARLRAVHNRTGYNLFDVKKKGTFDLTPLLLGSQGTLGIITEATLQLARHNPIAELAIISVGSLSELQDILPSIIELKPSICEMINKAAINQINKANPNQLKGILQNPAAEIHLVIEFDDEKEGAQKKALKALDRLATKAGGYMIVGSSNEDRDKINKLRRAAAALHFEVRGGAKAVPVAEDVTVPIDRLADFMSLAAKIYTGGGLQPAMWGHAGDGVVRMQPLLDLAQIGDRQKLYKLQDLIYNAALNMGGSISAAAGDGRIRAPYMGHVYGKEALKIMLQVKQIFDPYGILNRGVKTASAQEVKTLMRTEYSRHSHEHLPHG
jgi:FAD/FMN-containing dehydrogenase